jgi:AraC-like DNA-binding protein
MPYREQPAPRALSRWIECAWSIETAAPLHAYPVRPDACIDIVYSAAGLQLVGAMTVERRFDLAANALTAGIRFRPGMAPSFLRIPAIELTNQMLPWDTQPELANRIADARSAAECREILLTALRPLAEAPNGVQRAIEAVTRSHGDIHLEWVARQAGMTARQFRRRCLEESGLAPKQLCRVLRFRRACTLARQGLPWGLVAAEAGYFDQAHLIHDFRDFTGDTPMSVFSNTPARSAG